MSTNLPGNPHAFVATERLLAMSSLDLKTIDLAMVADAITQSNLAIAFELRTQTLAQINIHNRREAARMHGANFEEMPEEVREMIAEQGTQVEERLGR